MADVPGTPIKRGGLPWESYPTWWKVASAFGIGVILAGLSLLIVLPKGLQSLRGGAGGVGGLGPGEAGGTEDYIIDPVTGEIIGRAGTAGAAGTSASGRPGQAGRGAGRPGGGTSNTGGPGGPGSTIGGPCVPVSGVPGVTNTEVKMGATVAESGIAEAFLGEVSQAMEAARINYNNSPACGRQLKIIYRDDEWKPDRGFEYIRNLVTQEKVFALAVVPSSEGLNSASEYIRENGIPVPGADGMIKSQNTNPYIWPVASATTTQMHVMMRNAWDRGARNPAIVFENTYRFGVEGAAAFNAAYGRLKPGSSLGSGTTCGGRFCGIPADQPSYGAEVSAVNNACNTEPRCDFLALLLEPVTAQKWMATSGVKQPKDFPLGPGELKGMGTAQPLFTYSFGDTCHDKCNGMWVWTGYNPTIEQYANSQAVVDYVSALDSKCRNCDEFNQFTEGGYIGMKLIIEALRRTPNLTRQNFTNTLNSMSLDTGLSPGLSWSASNHFANPAAQAFEIQSKNGFTGWRFVQGYVSDPWLGQDS